MLGIKNAGADAVYLPLVANSNIAVVQGLAQNGVKMKSTILATGYGQPLLDQPVSETFGPEVVMLPPAAHPSSSRPRPPSSSRPTSRSTPATPACPTTAIYTGYITCDMAIVGLQNAGNPPTRAAFAPNLRKLGTYDQAGLACRPIDISTATYGQAIAYAAAAGTCRSRTASSCSSRRTGSHGPAS